MWDKIDNLNFFTPDFGIVKSFVFIGFLCLVPIIVVLAMLTCHYHQKKVIEYEKEMEDDGI